jgi:metal-responsive CopG/Arc/MetJ family transcriptional regulator
MSSQITVRIPEELDERITIIAGRLHFKRSVIIRMALEKFVDDCKIEGEKTPYENIKHLVGSFASGYTDLGTSHRKHLLKYFKRHHG